MSVDWSVVTALATILSGVAVGGSVWLVLIQLQRQAQEAFVSATSDLCAIWEEGRFQRAQQWGLHDLSEPTWRAFVAAHRGKPGQRDFLRVGSYYNRVGYLVSHDLLGGHEQILLDNISATAIAVWQKIEPLVLEARLIDNSTLFEDYQGMLPECYACYVPSQPVPARILADAEQAKRLATAEAERIATSRRSRRAPGFRQSWPDGSSPRWPGSTKLGGPHHPSGGRRGRATSLSAPRGGGETGGGWPPPAPGLPHPRPLSSRGEGRGRSGRSR